MPRATPVHTPPIYCSVDGYLLEDRTTGISEGFDPFTGIERPPRQHITRECPKDGHDVWCLIGDEWVTP